MNCVYIFLFLYITYWEPHSATGSATHILLGSCEVLIWFYVYTASNTDMINTRYYHCRSQNKPLASLESALLLCLLPSTPLKSLPSWVTILV